MRGDDLPLRVGQVAGIGSGLLFGPAHTLGMRGPCCLSGLHTSGTRGPRPPISTGTAHGPPLASPTAGHLGDLSNAHLDDNPSAAIVCSWSSACQSTRPPTSG